MQPMYYVGLDVHKQKISYCLKDSSGKIYAEGWIRDIRATIQPGCLPVSSSSARPNAGRYRPKFNSKSLGTP